MNEWEDDSGLFDEKFSSKLSSIPEVQTSGDLDCISATVNPLNENTPAEECCYDHERNLTLYSCIEGSSQHQCPLLCEIDSNHQNIWKIKIHEVETLSATMSQSSFYSNPSPPHTALSKYEPTHSTIKVAELKTYSIFDPEDYLRISKSDVKFETLPSNLQPKKLVPFTTVFRR